MRSFIIIVKKEIIINNLLRPLKANYFKLIAVTSIILIILILFTHIRIFKQKEVGNLFIKPRCLL